MRCSTISRWRERSFRFVRKIPRGDSRRMTVIISIRRWAGFVAMRVILSRVFNRIDSMIEIVSRTDIVSGIINISICNNVRFIKIIINNNNIMKRTFDWFWMGWRG
jgi:hypothetical protein